MSSPYLRRKPRGLLWFWAFGLAVAALVYWITWKIPALSDLLRPVYWVIAAALAIFTGRWFRPRSGERRQEERRQDERRGDPDKV